MSGSTKPDRYEAWVVPSGPATKQHFTTAASAGTYQATGNDVGKLHVFVSAKDCLVEGGTGSTVTVSTGLFVKSGVPWYFVPKVGRESLGYRTADGTNYSSALPATVAMLDNNF